jgi:hypothetical protein
MSRRLTVVARRMQPSIDPHTLAKCIQSGLMVRLGPTLAERSLTRLRRPSRHRQVEDADVLGPITQSLQN